MRTTPKPYVKLRKWPLKFKIQMHETSGAEMKHQNGPKRASSLPRNGTSTCFTQNCLILKKLGKLALILFSSPQANSHLKPKNIKISSKLTELWKFEGKFSQEKVLVPVFHLGTSTFFNHLCPKRPDGIGQTCTYPFLFSPSQQSIKPKNVKISQKCTEL